VIHASILLDPKNVANKILLTPLVIFVKQNQEAKSAADRIDIPHLVIIV